ncbi:MAG: hypothetical protein KatS3mg101_1027 [Patescibacteria group bacterium]|nr:MAG: hypothetical protein KatS3mg101_1027 [Patescibacteria group bacterium]
MKYSTTDGREWFKSDMCFCCRVDTAGNHELNCPNNFSREKNEKKGGEIMSEGGKMSKNKAEFNFTVFVYVNTAHILYKT